MNWHGERVIIWKVNLVGREEGEGGMSRKACGGRHGHSSVALKGMSNEESMPEPMGLEDK